MSLTNLSVDLEENATPSAEDIKRLIDIRVQLQHIKRRVRDENIQVPARLARLFELNQADEDD